MPEIPAYRIDWDGCDAPAWDRLLCRANAAPLVQGWAYGAANAAAERAWVRRGVILREARPVAILQIFETRFLGARLVKLFRGPLWLDAEPPAAERAAVLALLRRTFRLWRGTLLLFMPELHDSADHAALLRRAGFTRVVTGASSIRLSLRAPESALRAGLDGKWRNALVRAEAAGLAVETGGGPAALDWLLTRYAELKQARKFKGPDAPLVRAMVAAGAGDDALVLRALENNEPIAGVLLLRHGNAATYLVGWTGDAGRRVNAHNLLLWRAMMTLKARDLAWLDVGNLDPDSTPGIAAFKLGLGGEPYTLCGVFV